MRTINVGKTNAVILVSAGDGMQAIINTDATFTLWLSDDTGVSTNGPDSIPLGPGGSLVVSGDDDVYAVSDTTDPNTIQVLVIKGGIAYFLGLTQGFGKLAIGQLQSPNFLTGVRGWCFFKNGNAEFNNVLIRGGVQINGQEFLYIGGIAANTLFYSNSATDGQDSAGNWYLSGTVNYGPNVIDGVGYIAVQVEEGFVSFYSATVMTGAVSPWSKEGNIVWSASTGFLFQSSVGSKALIEGFPLVLEGSGNIQAKSPIDMFPVGSASGVAGHAVCFSNTQGGFSVVDGTDGNAYGAERISDFLTSNTGTLVALTVVDGGPVGPRSYTIRFQFFINVPVANAQLNSEVQLPGGSTGKYSIKIFRGVTFFGSVAGGPNVANGIAVNLPAANDYMAELEGTFTVSAVGNMNVLLGSLTAQGIVVESFSRIDLIPV